MEQTDKLKALAETASRARDLELRLEDLRQEQKRISDELLKLYRETLPTMFDDAGLDSLGVPASGNKPGIDYELHSYYSAGIASKWPENKRQEAFDLLRRLKAESLIKTVVEARLPKGNVAAARKIVAAIRRLKVKGAAVDLRQSVHKGTLSSWLKSLYQDERRSLSDTDLAKIGASVGRVVRIKNRKDENGDDE